VTSGSKDTAASIIGARIRAAREAVWLSQEEAARLAGLHRTYIGAVERGERNITVISLVRIARVVGVSASQLLADL
jgi:transcriptional regulator with XRE-family HTH domain